MRYRLNKEGLWDYLTQWNAFLKRKVHLIACGGTALTLLDVKASTKDIDFMVPVLAEHSYLIKALKSLGYNRKGDHRWTKDGDPFVFDLFAGNKIHTTELLNSPLKPENHRQIKTYSYLYIGVLNDYDLITSKLFRGAPVDFDDCRLLVKAHRATIDLDLLEKHFREHAKYEIAETRVLQNLGIFLKELNQEKYHG